MTLAMIVQLSMFLLQSASAFGKEFCVNAKLCFAPAELLFYRLVPL
jgi:hypothetical protein